MGGFEEVMLAVNAASGLAGLAAQDQQARGNAKAQAQQAEVQNKMLWQQHEQQTKRQQDLLKRQLASSRAALAAGGVGFAGGSGQALMQGMARNAQQGIADSYADASLRHEAQSAGQSGGSSAAGLAQGLQTIGQGMSILKPWITK